MPIETKESIKNRLHQEAARQWGVDEIDLKNGSFDPLVDLLFGAFATETEKVWQEIESSRSHTVKRMVEAVLPETITGILPAHSVMLIKAASGPVEIIPSDQFITAGSNPVTMSPAGSFRLAGATVKYIASGSRIDKINAAFQRETAFRINSGKPIASQTCWVGIELPDKQIPDQLTLFFNWNSTSDQAKYISYVPLIEFRNSASGTFSDPVKRYERLEGILPFQSSAADDFFKPIEESVRESYASHFVTLTGLSGQSECIHYPKEWAGMIPEANSKTLFPTTLLWIRLQCPASIPADALDRMEVLANCVPVLNRKLVHQRGRLQPLFNVYGLKDDAGFMSIQKVADGDGETLSPVAKDRLSEGQNVYAVRNRGIARFDKRDAFESLSDVTAKMRDDLAAFNALDISAVSNHLETINKSVSKLKEHLETFDFNLPQIYILVKTRSAGTILDVYFWTSEGERANGLRALTKLNPESGNRFKAETCFLMLPTTGGRAPMDDAQMQKAFKEALLTRGRAVTIEDYRTIAQTLLGNKALKVTVKKGLGVGEGHKEGLRFALDITIFPNPSTEQSEEYWMKQARLVKNSLLQKSAGLMPLYIAVDGFNWKM